MLLIIFVGLPEREQQYAGRLAVARVNLHINRLVPVRHVVFVAETIVVHTETVHPASTPDGETLHYRHACVQNPQTTNSAVRNPILRKMQTPSYINRAVVIIL